MPIQVIYVTVETPVTEVVDVTVNGDAVDVVDVLVGPETAQLQADIDANTAVIAALQPTEWTTLPYANGWSDYSAAWNGGEYRKYGDAVELRGLLSPGTISDGIVIATLPVGFRPPEDLLMSTMFDGASTDMVGRIDIMSNGEIRLRLTGVTPNVWVSFSNLRFSTI